MITEFWRNHPKFWFAPEGPLRKEADAVIHQLFWGQSDSTWIDRVIYLDQFMRHFSRVVSIISDDIIAASRIYATYIVEENKESLATCDQFELVFCLMPFKHIENYDFIFQTIHHCWLATHSGRISDYPLLMRFYADTYTKCYSRESVIQRGILLAGSETEECYDPDEICEFCPTDGWCRPIADLAAHPLATVLVDTLKYIEGPVVVSLSGGVDSMSLCHLLSQLGISFVAVHIIYGNRATSMEELHFIKDYCKRLGVPLRTYQIEWIKRNEVDRAFYEEITRRIRFSVYRCLGEKADSESNSSPVACPYVLMGHIQDDVVENIWTNFAHGTHLDDLMKMAFFEKIEGVVIVRPWLKISKKDIYHFSETYNVPYLKNTTPSWSNRGKFREKFHKETLLQYGESTDAKVIQTATMIAEQFKMIDKLLYQPMFRSWNADDNTIDVTLALSADLSAIGWEQLLTRICHEKLGISKPSIHSCRYFTENVKAEHATPRSGVHSRTLMLSGKLTAKLVLCPSGQRLLRFMTT